METLAEIVKRSVFEYAGGGINLKVFPFANDDQQAYSVVAVDTPIRKQNAGIMVMARLMGEYVIIEEDNTDRPLYEVLVKRGIPSEKIICAYAGDSLPVLEKTA